MSHSSKKNVSVFNSDVNDNQGYRYTTHASLSSILANKRITDATVELLDLSMESIIDIGCGDGSYTNEIKTRRPQLTISAFDPAEQAIISAQNKYPQINFFVANLLESSTLRNHHFDLGIIRGVLHHLSDPKLAIANAGLVTKKIIIVEPNGNNPILKIIEKISPYHREHEEQSFSSKQLKKWCLESGYNIKHLDYVGFIPFFFPSILSKIIFFFQPFLEKIHFLKKYFAGQIIIMCEKN